jgi:TrmH family RNA methyltransferase
MPISLGLHSPKIEALRPLLTSKGRREQRLFLVEGLTMLAEALSSNLRPEAIYAVQTELDALDSLVKNLDIPIYLVPERALARLSDLESPPGILAVFTTKLRSPEDLFAQGRPLVLLAGIADPGNAGTLLRSADIFGVAGVIFGANGVEPYNPKIVRASMGAIFRLPLALAQPQELLSAARSHNYTIIATSREGTPLPAYVFPPRALIAVGNERRGVASWLPSWDSEVAIPHRGNGESLNAAVAGSIIFYAFSQQNVHPSEVS